MTYTGIVRNIDDLGRVTLPKELRDIRGIKAGDPVEIYVDGDAICLEKHVPGCTLCGSSEQLMDVEGVLICRSCGVKVVDMFMKE